MADEPIFAAGVPGSNLPERRRRTVDDAVTELKAELLVIITEGDAATAAQLQQAVAETRAQIAEVRKEASESHQAIMAHLSGQDSDIITVTAQNSAMITQLHALDAYIRDQKEADAEAARIKAEQDHDAELIRTVRETDRAAIEARRKARNDRFGRTVPFVQSIVGGVAVGDILAFFQSINSGFHLTAVTILYALPLIIAFAVLVVTFRL